MRFDSRAGAHYFPHRLGLALAIAVAITACGPPTPVYQVQHALTPPPTDTGRLCAAQCLNTKQHCVQNAQLRQSIEQDRCEARARQDAHREYLSYVARRKAKGKRIKRSERDFYSGYSCRNTKDDGFCLESYHQCYTTCGGQVASKSICVANCDVPATETGSITQAGSLLASSGQAQIAQAQTAHANLPMSGTWGITQQACAPANVGKDGVLQISNAQIRNGLDLCLVDQISPLANGTYEFKTRCQSAEGGKATPVQFLFSASDPNTLTNDNRQFGRIEQWVRCS